jgi:adenylate cyclase class 2
MLETEVKIKITDPASIREKILAASAQLEKEKYFEENILYDFPDQTLLSKKQAIRLRTIGKKNYLAFKGAPQKSRSFKIREEFETEVKNPQHQKKILKNLGLQPTFQYQKHRTVFRMKSLKICLDEMSIGNYLELEGKQNHIVQFAKTLGFTRNDFIKKDYVQLIKETE